MHVGETLSFLPGLVRLVYVRNVGAAFGLFPGGRPLFVLTSLVVLVFIAAYWRRDRPTKWPVVIALALITAGAFGNLIDRAVIGEVTDFFDFMFVSFPVFNIADMSIVCGVALLMIWILFGPQPGKEVVAAATPESAAGSGGAATPDPAAGSSGASIDGASSPEEPQAARRQAGEDSSETSGESAQ